MGIEQDRDRLREFINYKDGEEIRSNLHLFAKENYKPKHAEKYLLFMNDNACTFTENHAQSENHPFFFTLFTCASQHVMGDCVEECLDKSIDKAGYA